MKRMSHLLTVLLLLLVRPVLATDTYDPATGVLTIPAVQVGDNYFKNVQVSVGSIIKVGQTTSTTLIDVYDAATNQLRIPSVRVGSTTYSDVTVTVGKVHGFESVTTFKGLRPMIAWSVAPTPALETWDMLLCASPNQCDGLGGRITIKTDPNNPLSVIGSANGVQFDDVTRSELTAIISKWTRELNTVLVDLWKNDNPPTTAVIADVINTAAANAQTPDELLSLTKQGFTRKGFNVTGYSTSTANTSGYQCPTTKPVSSPDWLQSHTSYWAAASAHDAYVNCSSTGGSNCSNYLTMEKQYCDYASQACQLVAAASQCPG